MGQLVLTGEERLVSEQLSQDASDRPHVDSGTVGRCAKETLGWPVPSCDDPIPRGVLPLPLLYESRQSEICDAKSSVFCDKQVGCLDIAVKYFGIMAEAHCF